MKCTNKTCDKEISPSAKVCPECGHPIKEKKKERENLLYISIAFVFFIVFMILYKSGVIENILNNLGLYNP